MKSEHGTKTLGALLSVTPGEIHLRELQRQTSLDAANAEQRVTVLALGSDGVPARVDLQTTMKWSARGWELQLACPACGEPSRVLRQRGEVYCCGRCAPRSTPHHRFKNCRIWRDGGRTTSQVVNHFIRGDGPSNARLHELATELVHGTVARAETLLPHISATLDSADELVRHRESEKRE